jgi:hypothetical protein
MALKQTRRSISVRGTTYDKLRQYGETHDRSMSDIVEELLATILGPEEVRGEVKAAEPKLVQPKPVAPTPERVREKSEARLRFNPPPVQKPRPMLANRVVRAVPPPPRPASNKPQLPGRPAPTPASQVIKVRRDEFEKDDYRAIRF